MDEETRRKRRKEKERERRKEEEVEITHFPKTQPKVKEREDKNISKNQLTLYFC